MVKTKVTIGSIIAVIILAIMFIHPVKVLSNQSYRYRVFLTLSTTEVESFVPMSGGWRAYINEDEYLWFSNNSYEYAEVKPFGVRWGFPWQKPTLQMGVK